jgi:monothiol glutaredoxin
MLYGEAKSMANEGTLNQIKKQLAENDIVLYMKGTALFPQCGFSGKVVYILKELGVDFMAVNVLEDDAIREGIKIHGDWPTIPQLYIKGELIGGCDIITELHQNGELKALLEGVSA